MTHLDAAPDVVRGDASAALVGDVDRIRRIRLDPPARAMLWHGVGEAHERRLVHEVALAAGEALVAVELATICGSDVHTTLGHRPAPTPLVLGHEQVGRVTAVGDGVVDVAGDEIVVGDRVVWSVTVQCGACERCLRGMPQKCELLRKLGHERATDEWTLSGGFASHVHLPVGAAIVRVPDAVDAAALAPVACATSTAWAAVDALDPIAGDGMLAGRTVLVLGAGLVGLSAAAIAASRGARVTVVDPDASRRARAEAFGICSALAAVDGRRFDGVVEASGAPSAVRDAIESAAIGGVVALVGSVSPGPTVPVDPEAIVRGLVTIRGVHNYAPQQLAAAAGWMVAHPDRMLFASLVAHTVHLEAIDEGLHAAAGHPLRVGVRP